MRRVIIAGTRTLPHTTEQAYDIYVWLNKAFELFVPDVVLCGDAAGIDTLGNDVAKAWNVQVEHYPADWAVHGLKAGYIRNREMALKATELWLIWDGRSRGSKMMKELALQHGLLVLEYIV